MITPQLNMKLRVKKKVKIIDNSYNMPGPGHLNEGTIVQVSSRPTSLSDVPFKVIQGSGEYTSRGMTKNTTRTISNGSSGLFFLQGHTTVAPYDWGKLDTEYFEVFTDANN